MANETVPQSENDPQNWLDDLQKKTMQLHALLQMAYGGGRENFSNLNDDLRDSYVWACADLAGDCETLAGKLPYQRPTV